MIEELLTRTRQYLTTLSWLLALLETAAALVAGGLVAAAIGGKLVGWAVFASVLYLVFFAVKLYTQKLFPASLFGELEAKEKLRQCQAQLIRRDRMFSYIDASIEHLNKETCNISYMAAHEVCDDSVEDGLHALLEPIITRPQYVLSCDSSSFTIAARIGHSHSQTLDWVEYFIVFRDDLELGKYLVSDEDTKDLFTDLAATGTRLSLRNAMHFAYNNNEYHVTSIKDGDRELSVLLAPIPLVCEASDAGGVLMLATDCRMICPCDMPEVLRIYGRLIANWLSKYSECVSRRQELRERVDPYDDCCAEPPESMPNSSSSIPTTTTTQPTP